MQRKRLFISIACGILLMTAGCFSRGEESSPSEDEANPAAQVATVQPGDAAPAAGAPASDQADGAETGPGIAQTVENAAAINS